MALSEATASLLSFFIGATSLLIPLICQTNFTLHEFWSNWWILIHVVNCVVIQAGIRAYFQAGYTYQITCRGALLGCVFSLGLMISFCTSTWTHFGWYITCLSIFHWSEFYTTAVTNPSSLTLESYLLDHSREYKLAAIASWTEFCIEWFLFPGLKQLRFVSIFGLLLVMLGEVTRKASMITASTNFNHYVQYVKKRDHQLVTHGVYSLCRHPSYVGWFIWSIGTQIMLCNPVCLIGYTMVSWRFFKERIYEEEIYLLNFFGMDYIEYQKKVGTGLPFIYGYRGQV